MPGKPLSLDTNDILKRYIAGEKIVHIAKAFGVSVTPIRRIIKDAGIEISKSPGNKRDDISSQYLVDAYAGGKNIAALAREHGVTHKVIRRILVEQGVKIISKASSNNRASTEAEKSAQIIASRYLAGETMPDLARSFSVSDTKIKSILDGEGIKTRTLSEAMSQRWADATPEQRKAMLDPAHDAARGRQHTKEEVMKRQLTRAGTDIADSVHQRDIEAILTRKGVDFSREVLIDKYLVDLVIGPVAVEIFGGSWRASDDHAPRFQERFIKFVEAGYFVLVINADSRRYPITEATADYLIAYADFARRNPSALCQYRMIWRDGEWLVEGSVYGDDFTIEPPFTNRRNPTTGRYETVAR